MRVRVRVWVSVCTSACMCECVAIACVNVWVRVWAAFVCVIHLLPARSVQFLPPLNENHLYEMCHGAGGQIRCFFLQVKSCHSNHNLQFAKNFTFYLSPSGSADFVMTRKRHKIVSLTRARCISWTGSWVHVCTVVCFCARSYTWFRPKSVGF